MDNSKNDSYYIQKIKHDCENVDLNVVFETLKNDIPELLVMISKS